MRVYIAYKYSNVDDKQSLVDQIESLAKSLESKGYSAFVLGRDVQNWGKNSLHTFKKLGTIIENLKSSDFVLAFITSEVRSKGLFLELVLAKLFGKKVKVALKKGMKNTCPSFLIDETLEFETIQDISY